MSLRGPRDESRERRGHGRSVVAAVVLLLIAAPACGADDEPARTAQDPGGGPVCTEIGCSSGVSVQSDDLDRRAPGWRSVTVCLEDRCRRFERGSGGPLLAMVEDRSLRSERRVRVRVVVRGRGGRRLLRAQRTVMLRRTQPNGPGCEPVCFQASLRLVGGRLRPA